MLLDLTCGRIDLSLQLAVKLKALLKVQLRLCILAAHEAHNSSVAISFGELRCEFDGLVEICESTIKVAFFQQESSAIFVESRMRSDRDGLADIRYGHFKITLTIIRHPTKVVTELQVRTLQFNRFCEIGNRAIKVILFKAGDAAL